MRDVTPLRSAGHRETIRAALIIVCVLALSGVAVAWVGHARRMLPLVAAPGAVQLAPPAVSAAHGDAAFPLRLSANRRYVIDGRGRPFLIVGDSPQALIVNTSIGQADRFLRSREMAGFNSVWVNLLCNTYTGGRPGGSTYDGIRPFRRSGDLSAPNDAYFSRADAMIRLAARHGMAVFLDPIETGGWLNVLRDNGVAKAYAFGRYLGRRYRAFPNIVWMSGNDFQTWPNPADDRLVLAVARGIRSVDPRALQTVELNYLDSGSRDDSRWNGLISLDAAYTYHPTYARVLKEYSRSPPVPVVMVEANYEGEHEYYGPMTLRRQEYWTALSGAAGQFYGNKYTWPFRRGWQPRVDTKGSRQMTYVTNLLARRRWFDLVPDAGHRVIVSGYGSYSSTSVVDVTDHVAVARTRDGRLVIAYVPAGQTIGVDMSKLFGRVRARWYDPAAGAYQPVAGSPFESSGTHRFVPPGRNADGDRDWILVLTAA